MDILSEMEWKACCKYLLFFYSLRTGRICFLFLSLLGVYLSKYSDLLQMNPFEAGASGDIIIFKVMKVIFP